MAERGNLARLAREYDVVIDWRGFELHPEIPPGGMRLDHMFPRDQIEMFHLSIARLAAAQGAGAMVFGERAPHTRTALAVAEYARERERLFPFKEAMMAAFWRDGRDVEEEATVADALALAGLDVAEGLSARRDPVYLARVDAMRKEANAAGVKAIPTMLFDTGERIVGAQRWEVFVETARSAGLAPRPR